MKLFMMMAKSFFMGLFCNHEEHKHSHAFLDVRMCDNCGRLEFVGDKNAY